MQFRTNLIFLGCSLVLACAACSPSPQPETAAQPQPEPAPAPATADAGPAPQATIADVLLSQAKISRDAATRTALAQVPGGIIRDAELENEHRRLVWSFDIATPDSRDITEIQVDATTGEIASTQVETPADQAQETAADKAAEQAGN